MAKSKPQKAKAAAEGAWGNQYVQRFVQDEELRSNVRDALENARSAYARLNNGKSASKVVMEDKKFQKDLKNAADSLKEAGDALREGPKRKRRGGFGKLVLLAIIGGGLAIALSEDVRNKVLDLLFGKEEEFDYTSTTAPPATPQPTAGAST
jgi:hypothetical protein